MLRLEPASHPSRSTAGAPPGALRLLLAALFLVVFLPAPAGAHTRLESSAPAADAVLRTPPAEIRLRFSGRAEPTLTGATLTTAAGDTIPVGRATVEPGSANRAFVIPIPTSLAPGQYLVEWRTAGTDGHVIRGAFTFLVEGLAPAAPAEPAADTAPPPDTGAVAAPPTGSSGTEDAASPYLPGSPLSVLVRWLAFTGLLGLVGSAAFRLAVLPAAERRGLPAEAKGRAVRGLRVAALASVAIFGLGLAGRLWLQAAALVGPDGSAAEGAVATILATGWGKAWTAQAAAAAVFLAALLLFRGKEGAAGWRTAAAATVIAAAATAFSGHAAAVERARGLALFADTLHVLGAGAWMGTLTLLLGVGIPAALGGPAGGKGQSVVALIRAFSPVALAAAALVAATGVASALFHVGTPADLWESAYGRALLLKLALVAVAAGAGFRNWRVLTPRLESDPEARALRRTVAVEVAMGVGVVLVTAVLVALPMP